ncbi:hypothetical protein CONCODRAFT_16758 [Conidiobolus coronatus NRRL 28638]|uniref:Uncharacterized protein n=1 Tax=Conidiobolus coronatus (strain ATCC 28846 / CBS 209.66 / NRRL 28638) TaxID=796925 RepID=A0A137P9G1_CONC2|nr:hypothetical protein CONCODRAFT_16758 [Conidiobolus coronatus NRRL 28638]|eukprot:KXN71648.1 hypothetical protein CONCODRAFT_16758 [Conidiobolus coronatus NRRL 28638]
MTQEDKGLNDVLLELNKMGDLIEDIADSVADQVMKVGTIPSESNLTLDEDNNKERKTLVASLLRPMPFLKSCNEIYKSNQNSYK